MHHTPLQIIQFMIQLLELLVLMKQLLLKVLILGLGNHRLHQLFIFLLLAAARPATVVAQTTQPNILWIVGENLCLDLGVYGMKNVEIHPGSTGRDSWDRNGVHAAGHREIA